MTITKTAGINWPLLDKCFDRILNHPDSWDQTMWLQARPIDEVPADKIKYIEQGADAMCGTTACLAGHAMIQSGEYKQVITWVDRNQDDEVVGFSASLLDLEGFPVGDETTIGAELLGLPDKLAYYLFHMTDRVSPQHFVAWARYVIDNWDGDTDNAIAVWDTPGFEDDYDGDRS